VAEADLQDGQVLYGLSPYCTLRSRIRSEEEELKVVGRMQHVWQAALQSRLGKNKNVNVERIFLLYTKVDSECQYPAKLFNEDSSTFA